MARTPWEIQKSVVFALFIRELKTRFGSYKGGYIWMLFEPVAHVFIISAIFSYVRQVSLFAIDLSVFLTTGVVPFLLIKNIALRVMDGVDANRGLFGFRQIRPMDTFIARALLDGLLSLIVFAVLLAILAFMGMDIPMRDPLTVGFVFLIIFMSGLGLGMIFCIIIHYMPESKILLRLLFLPLYLLSGVIYPIASLNQEVRTMLMWNPMLHAIETLRGAFFTQYSVSSGINFIFPMLTALVLLFLGLALYRTHRIELLSQ